MASQPNRKRRKLSKTTDDYIIIEEDEDSPPRVSLSRSYSVQCNAKMTSQRLSSLKLKENKERIDTDYMLFSDSFAPTKSSDIAIHSGKSKQIKSWLENCIHKLLHLLLTGPPGSGKSSSLRILAAEAGIVVEEWSQEDDFDEGENRLNYSERELEHFFRFIRINAGGLEGTKYIKLVRYLPYLAYRNPTEFRQELSKSLKYSRQPVVFCLCDVNSFYDVSPEKIFTPFFITEIQIHKIAINAVNKTNRTRIFKKVQEQLRGRVEIPENAIKTISDLSEGDIRTALNMIHFSQTLEGTVQIDKCLQKALTDEMFHMIGRIMYAHRLPKVSLNECPSWLPLELHRPPPENDINDILGMSNLEPSDLMLYVHEYESAFSPSISATAKVLESISFADSLTNRWDIRMRLKDTAEKSSMQADEYLSQITARSAYFYNFNKVNSNFLGFKLPRWRELTKQIRSLTNDLHRTINFSRLGSTAALLQIGMFSKMHVTVHRDQFELISYICRPMSFPWNNGRQHYQNMLLQRRASTGSTGITIEESKTASVFPIENNQNNVDFDSDKEEIIIENSEESEDSFDEDPFN